MWAATLAAAGGGNFIYHLIERSLYRGTTLNIWANQFQTFTYFLMLGMSVSLTQIWLMARGRRQPWTPDFGVGLDALAVASTVGFFVLIRPLYHIPLKHSISDAGAVLLAAFGIR